MITNALISGADVILSIIFTALVLRQYLARRKIYQLTWSVALALWTIAVFAELIATFAGWSAWTYRAYYAAGALLVSAWLGMGTLYLILAKAHADRIQGALAVTSLLGVILIVGWPIAPEQLQTTAEQFLPLRVFPFFPVQLALIGLNIFGTISFVGGGLWSAYKFARTRAMSERARATALIATGGLIAATAHSLGALGGIELFRVSELFALIFIFAGFLLSTPATRPNTNPAPRAAG
ncbi:MAG: hypothetical protein HY868_24695 [Chloroflexi bacterium]|nr:hypothetical protein [Chloroflexota bacterium]